MNSNRETSVDKNIPSFYSEDLTNIKSFTRKMSHRHYINAISKFISSDTGSSLLDIGCGTGSFLFHCERKFSFAQLHGLEYDDRLVKQAITNLSRAEISQGNAEKLPYEDGSFDVITSFQVIEHVANPNTMLSEIKRILKPNGIVLITTPNLQGLGRRIHGSNWTGFRSDHISLKGASDWDALISENGFSKIQVGTTFFSGLEPFKVFPLSLINNGLLGVFGWLPWNLGESFVGIYQRK